MSVAGIVADTLVVNIQGQAVTRRTAEESRHGAGGGLRILRAGIPVAGANTGRLGARGYGGVVLLQEAEKGVAGTQ